MYRKLTITRLLLPAIALLTLLSAVSCLDTEELENRLDSLENRIAAMEKTVGEINDNIVVLHKLYDKNLLIVGKTEIKDGTTVKGYTLEFSDGSKADVTFGADYNVPVPQVRITDGYWEYSCDGGKTWQKEGKVSIDGNTPQFKVDADGYWLVSNADGEYGRVLDELGRPVSATDGTQVSSRPIFTDVQYNESKGVMVFTLADGQVIETAVTAETFFVRINEGKLDNITIYLEETKEYTAELGDVAGIVLTAPDGWAATLEDNRFTVTSPATGTAGEYTIEIHAVSAEGHIKKVEMTFNLKPIKLDAAMTPAWNNFVADNENNVLLDYSYAGYDHGETAPAEAFGYKVYDVTEYGAVPDDGKSDREAFLKALTAISGTPTVSTDNLNIIFPHKNVLNAVLYFPPGEFILHTEEDNVTVNGRPQSQSIVIRGGNFILKGAGRDLTRILMDAPNLPVNPDVMYSSPDMIQLKHNSSSWNPGKPSEDLKLILAKVTGPAEKGAFEVTVESTSGISVGDWVCLHVKNNDEDFVNAELAPYADKKNGNWEIVKSGVEVIDYHQIKAVNGNTVTFHEPIMHEILADKGWEIRKYPHYTEVGVEDLTFAGHAKEYFGHHASWADDGAYKPLSMTRLTNSWLRRVRFESTSEACSFINCANVSAYQIEFTGNRGHSAVRSQASSRAFIGATVDKAKGYLVNNSSGVLGTYSENAGNYHAVGVSKQSIGAVLWRNVWGDDSCFESHATQPRATLIDCCNGGWMRWRQGGDETQVPNHLNDLTIWNFYATNANLSGTDGNSGINENFIWWDNTSKWWKILPPVIVGFHGPANTRFNTGQAKLIESEGTPVFPESLYEAQLEKRLGAVPAWLQSLK